MTPSKESHLSGRSQGAALLGGLGFGHAAVDAACALIVVQVASGLGADTTTALAAVLLYNSLAFAAQAPLGLVVDRFGARGGAAASGALFVASALALHVLLPSTDWLAVLLAGVGNAVFHLGGGAASLDLSPGRAWAPGVFVAPGAIGLALGTLAGKSGWSAWPFGVALIISAVVAVRLARPVPDAVSMRYALRPANATSVSIALVLAVVAARSFVSLGVALPWKASPLLLWVLIGASAAGKFAGGFLGDRWGRLRVGASALIAAVPLATLAASSPFAGITAMFLLNLTMPLTLTAVADAMPEKPAFAFGLTCLALAFGAYPVLLGLTGALSATWVVASLMLALFAWCAAQLPRGGRSFSTQGDTG